MKTQIICQIILIAFVAVSMKADHNILIVTNSVYRLDDGKENKGEGSKELDSNCDEQINVADYSNADCKEQNSPNDEGKEKQVTSLKGQQKKFFKLKVNAEKINPYILHHRSAKVIVN